MAAVYEWGHHRLYALGGVPARNIRRLLFRTAALPNATTLNTAHQIAGLDLSKVLQISGRAYNSTSGETIPLPYGHGTAQVTLDINATNIRIVTGTNMTNFADVSVYVDILDD